MKIVLIYSGGLDSTTLLYKLREEGHEILPLGINYGQRHLKELSAARTISAMLNLPYQAADLSRIRHLLAGSSQTSESIPVPEGHYAEESMKQTVVPNRNMIMLSIAIGYAVSTKADAVAFGAHAGDHTIYPDCRPEFADSMALAASLADWHPVKLLRPFIDLTKTDIANEAYRLGVPINYTWSCYKGGLHHCGKCGTCVERKEALGMADPTIYEADETPSLTS